MKRLITLLVFSLIVIYAKAQKLYSYPAATATIFIDFDGQTVDGTNWNTDGPIYCGASGLDANAITEIFNRVAEDYRPFNLNITTDSAKYWSAPANRRMRVIVTVTSDWYGPVGGTAMVNTFTSGDNTPCFVFSARLGYNIKKISEAVAHEAGHTLGLYHQSQYDASCNLISDYHFGTGTGEIGWAPIMGAGYYQNLTLWNNGPNSFGCTNYQNDLQIITTSNGFTYRTDDHGNTFAAATTTSFSGSQFTANGVIEKNTDMDMFRFVLPSTGLFQLAAIPYNVGTGNAGSDLDMQITLYNSSQAILNVYNPGSLLNSVIDSNLNAGTYYIKVEGKGNIYAPNYAVLGSYALQGTYTSYATLPLHKLVLSGSVDHEKHTLNWEIVADEPVTDIVLESSTNGIAFSVVNQPALSVRTFSYNQNADAPVQYRVRIQLGNGKEYYSNLVTLRSGNSPAKPMLVMNLVTGNNLTINSPGKYDYAIYASNGDMLSKGQLKNGNNTIVIPALSAGVYFIRYINPEHGWTEKFVRQ